MKASVEEYVDQIYRKLHEYSYDERTIRLQIVGGGGCLLEHFGHLRQGWDFITKDICAAAKGYEYLAELKLTRQEQA